MAAKRENQNHGDRITSLEFHQEKIILPKLEEHSRYIEENKPGVRFASLLDSRLTTILIGAAAAGILFLASKGIGI